MNSVQMMGRLTKDPELRQTQSGLEVASFSIAVGRDFKDKQTGERVTDFFDCVAWRETAKFISNYFSKGRMISIKGTLQTRTWQDRDGNNRKSVEILVDKAYFCGDKQDAVPQRAAPEVQNEQQEFTEIEEDDGELPF